MQNARRRGKCPWELKCDCKFTVRTIKGGDAASERIIRANAREVAGNNTPVEITSEQLAEE